MRYLIPLLFLLGCSDANGGPYDVGTDSEDDVTADTTPDTAEDPEVEDVEPDTGPAPLLSGVAFVQKGHPPSGHPVITDLTTFQDRLYLTTSVSPLGEFGANVFHTTDGSAFTQVLSDSSSQGFLRLRVIDSVLYIPDGDPNGYDPSYVHISTNGDDFVRSTVIGSVHTFDVILYNSDLLTSNGMMSGSGSLCRTTDGSTWTEIESTPYSRLKFMAIVNDRLIAGKRNVSSPADYVLWTGDVDTTDGTGIDAVPGEASTFRFHTTTSGRLFWSYVASSTLSVQYTDDGETWTPALGLSGEFVSDYAELDGNLYALSNTGLHGSTDHSHFTLITPAPTPTPFGPIEVPGGFNVEGGASMELFASHLWCGSSSDGYLYRIE